MTNYRINCDIREISMFMFCFTCGAKLTPIIETQSDDFDEVEITQYKECSQCKTHLKIWAMNDTDIEFI